MTHRRDEVSDPGLDEETGSDWSDEGGALPEGPATEPEAGAEEPGHGSPTGQQ